MTVMAIHPLLAWIGRRLEPPSLAQTLHYHLELADGVDLLIHEGTYGVEFTREAHQRGHSTVVDAAQLAREAGVGRLVITHISPKHYDIGPLKAAARAVFPETTIARDFDEFTVEATG